MAKAYDALTEKHRRFIDHYLVHLDGKAAAIAAGYSPKAANTTPWKILQREDVKAALAEAKLARQERVQIAQDRVVTELARIAFADPIALFNEHGGIKQLKDLPPEVRAAIMSLDFTSRPGGGSVLVKVRFHDKVGTLKTLLQHLEPPPPPPAQTSAALSINVSDLAKMSDAEVDNALARVNQMMAALGGTSSTPTP